MIPPPIPKPESDKPNVARRLAKAFLNVFGPPSRRSADQRLVIAHLRERCGRDTPVFETDKVGNFDPLRAAHKDGAQTQFLIIKRQVARAMAFESEEKPKVRVKRTKDE